MEVIGIVIIQLLKIESLLFLPPRCRSKDIIILITIFNKYVKNITSKLEEYGSNWNSFIEKSSLLKSINNFFRQLSSNYFCVSIFNLYKKEEVKGYM